MISITINAAVMFERDGQVVRIENAQRTFSEIEFGRTLRSIADEIDIQARTPEVDLTPPPPPCDPGAKPT